MQVLAIADDTTGALEVGAQFAVAGLRCTVSLERDVKGHSPSVVEALHTRHLDPDRARYRVSYRANAARRTGVAHLYKKTDSTLRGNVASEFQGLLDVYPDKTLLYAPAYPKVGRTVENGELYVNGVPLVQTAFAADALNPSCEGSIPALLQSGCKAPVLLASSEEALEEILTQGAAGSIVVCDGRTNRDLRWAAEVAGRFAHSCIAAGTAGFCGPWAKALPLERPFACRGPGVQRCLVVSGTRHPMSQTQVKQAAAGGIATFYLEEDAAADEDTASKLSAAISSGGWATLATPGTLLEDAAERMAAIACRVTESLAADGLVVFGGDTARAVLRAIAVSRVRSCRELLPGVPLSIIRMGRRELALISKAGGFGSPETLLSIRELLDQGL